MLTFISIASVSTNDMVLLDLKLAEDALQDHMPELHDDDLCPEDLECRQSLRRQRDDFRAIAKALGLNINAAHILIR